MHPSNCKTRKLQERGLSLIELMVGLTIGLMLTLGLFTLITNQSVTFKLQDDFARTQENGTLALRYIGESLRMAGFYGYVMDPINVNTAVAPAVTTTTDCGSATNLPVTNWALAVTVPIFGFAAETTATVNGTLPCINAANFQNGPILITRSASGYRTPDTAPLGNLTADLAAQPNFATTVYVQSDPSSGLLFYGTNFAALKAAGTTRSLPNGNDIDIFEYRAHVYYLRPCSRPNGGGPICTGAADDLGQPIPTLARQELIGSAMTEVPLVEGIERLDLRFGIDTNNDGVPNTFTATPAATDWANVVAVRVTLLARAPTITAGFSDAGKQYDLDGDGTVDFDCTVVGGTACQYKRKVFSQLFQLRNVAQRRGA